jgi:hypothetical protein
MNEELVTPVDVKTPTKRETLYETREFLSEHQWDQSSVAASVIDFGSALHAEFSISDADELVSIDAGASDKESFRVSLCKVRTLYRTLNALAETMEVAAREKGWT